MCVGRRRKSALRGRCPHTVRRHPPWRTDPGPSSCVAVEFVLVFEVEIGLIVDVGSL